MIEELASYCEQHQTNLKSLIGLAHRKD